MNEYDNHDDYARSYLPTHTELENERNCCYHRKKKEKKNHLNIYWTTGLCDGWMLMMMMILYLSYCFDNSSRRGEDKWFDIPTMVTNILNKLRVAIL